MSEHATNNHICRWSFRKRESQPDFKSLWGNSRQPLRDGDAVRLYCHSYHSGQTFDSAHCYWAPDVHFGMDNDKKPLLKVLKLSQEAFTNWRGKNHVFDEPERNLDLKSDAPTSIADMMQRQDQNDVHDHRTQRALVLWTHLFGFQDKWMIQRVLGSVKIAFDQGTAIMPWSDWVKLEVNYLGRRISSAQLQLEESAAQWRHDTKCNTSAALRIRFLPDH